MDGPRLRSQISALIKLSLSLCVGYFFTVPAFADVQVQLIQSQYLSSGQNETQIDRYSSLGVKAQQLGEFWHIGQYGVELMGLATMDASENAYIAIPQLYSTFRVPMSPELNITIGRKRMSWSQFDQEWRLGIWQPSVRWDYLHPVEEGLTGLFLGLEERNIQVVGFVTPFFVPDQGPQFQVVDGEFHSSNRWFRQPTSRHTVVGQDRRLNYELDKPAEKEVVLNAGYGLSLTLGQEQDGAWLKTSFANKPINQLHLGIEGYHSLDREDRFLESVAIVHPVVARHTVTTVEGGYRKEDYWGWVSITEERPTSPDLPEEWEESSLYSSRFLGGTFSHRVPIDGLRSHWLKYSYMRLTEDIPEKKVDSDTLESSLDRYPFSEVASVEWVGPMFVQATSRLDLGLRYLYSLPERGGLVSVKAEWRWRRDLRIDLGVDVLGSSVSDSDPRRGLMTTYRNNDRVIGGVTYVF